VYVAYVGKELVGVIILQTKGAFSGYLKSIIVKDSWRHKHLGNHFMEFVETTVFAQQPNVFLCVSSFNLSARQFYEKLGYEVIGELKNYLINGHDEILMRKTIGPILNK
jgi:ribosomal protein S18 acetylase RimI-like enzyme